MRTRLAPSLAVAAALAAWPAGAQQGTLRGVVYDSLAHRPLAGAVVQAVRAGDAVNGHAALADSTGAFRVDSLAPGRYLVGFSHPLLDLLRVEAAPRVIDVTTGETMHLDLAMPALASVRPIVCGSEQAANDSSGLLAGRVRDAVSGAPVAGATVVLTWSEIAVGAGGAHTEHRRVPVPTRPDGGYVMCGVPTGMELAATVTAPSGATGQVVLEVPARGLLVRDFTLGDTAAAPLARGTARLAGTVRDSAARPMRGARAFVQGTAATATTGDDGAFALDGLPAGTRTLEVRAIGFAPRQLAVDLAPGRADTVGVRMDRATVLAPVKVLGEFAERVRTNGFGRYLTAADLERTKPFMASEALRGIREVRLIPDRRFGSIVLGRRVDGRGRCQALIVVDGLLLLPDETIDQVVSPRDIAGIEYYDNPAAAPKQYTAGVPMNMCSVLLVWTKR